MDIDKYNIMVYFKITIRYRKEEKMLELDIEKLEIAMAREKLNRKDLAKKSGTSYASINAYFQKRIQPSLKTLGNISKALGTDVENIISRSS